MKTYAIDLGGTRIKLAIIIDGEICVTKIIPAHSDQGLTDRLPQISDILKEMDLNYQQIQLDGVGMAFPGIVNFYENRIVTSNEKYKDAANTDIIGWAKREFHTKIILDNDANAALLGEVYYGAAKGCENVAMMILGTGVGTASMIRGQMIRGIHGQAGCLSGHITMNLNGRRCNCGNQGCLEANASTWVLPYLVKETEQYLDSPFRKEPVQDFSTLRTYYQKGDPLAKYLFDHCVAYWGAGAVNLIHSYDPELIVLSGGVSRFTEIIRPIQKWIDEYAWTPWGRVRIIPAKQPESSVLLGLHYLVEESKKGVQ